MSPAPVGSASTGSAAMCVAVHRRAARAVRYDDLRHVDRADDGRFLLRELEDRDAAKLSRSKSASSSSGPSCRPATSPCPSSETCGPAGRRRHRGGAARRAPSRRRPPARTAPRSRRSSSSARRRRRTRTRTLSSCPARAARTGRRVPASAARKRVLVPDSARATTSRVRPSARERACRVPRPAADAGRAAGDDVTREMPDDGERRTATQA